jgi:hypothetical protein
LIISTSSVADRAARVREWEVRHDTATRQRYRPVERMELERRRHGEQQLGEQHVANRIELFGFAIHADAAQQVAGQGVEQVGEPDDVIEMGVRDKDVEPLGRHVVAKPVDGRARVEHQSQLRQHDARRFPRVAGVIAGRAEEN